MNLNYLFYRMSHMVWLISFDCCEMTHIQPNSGDDSEQNIII